MSLNVPDYMPVLSAGGHKTPADGACLMEMASFLAGEAWSDFPTCTNKVLARAAQQVNDQMRDGERQRLLDLLPRIMGTPENSNELAIAIVTAAADYVKPLIGHETEWVHRNAIDAQRNLARVELDPAARTGFGAVGTAMMDATLAADAAGMDMIEFLSALIDAYDVAVGRTSTPVVTADDLRRCAELTGASA